MYSVHTAFCNEFVVLYVRYFLRVSFYLDIHWHAQSNYCSEMLIYPHEILQGRLLPRYFAVECFKKYILLKIYAEKYKNENK